MVVLAVANSVAAQGGAISSRDGAATPDSSSLPQSPSSLRTADAAIAAENREIPGAKLFPNFISYDSSVRLPSQAAGAKLGLGLESSFGASAFLLSAAKAGMGQATNTYPAFHQGATGYGRYYWHAFADQAVESMTVEAVFPILLKQDSRYYAAGHGPLPKRTIYALSRLLITRNDAGNETFNASEIIGAGAAAGISTAYYPDPYRTWTKTGQRWLSNVLVDGGFMLAREFWPDVTRRLLRKN